MQHKIAGALDNIIGFLLLLVAGLTPVLFFNQTTEFFEVPKLLFLTVATLILLGLWIFSWIVKGKISISRTPLDVPLLMLLAVVILSTVFSVAKYPAIYGNFPRVHGSTISWVVYILLYFVTASNLRSPGRVKGLLYVLYGSGVVTAVITLLSFFGIYLPIDFAKAANFTPTGLPFSTTAFLMLLLPLPFLAVVSPNKDVPTPYALAITILFAVTIALTGSVVSCVVIGLVFVLGLGIAKFRQNKIQPLFLVPVGVMALTLALIYLSFPGNIVHQNWINFPREIQLPLSISWKITASAFRDAPFIGTGPASYLFDFTSYKPLEFNTLSYWNFSFDAAQNELLQVLATLGGIGLFALVFLGVRVVDIGRRSLKSSNEMLTALALVGFVAVILLFVHVTTLVSMVVTLFLLAAFMMSQEAVHEKVLEFSLGLKAATADKRGFDLFPVVIFVVFLVGAVPALYQTYKVAAGDYYHRKALSQANTNGTLTYQYLQKAEAFNPYIDLYRVDMAQTNFALANALAAQKGPTQASPAGSLTDQDKKTIQTLLSQAITEAKVSVALSPQSTRNWGMMASIYRNITGVAQNALSFSLDAYGRAIQRDPLNPLLRLNAGGVYYSAKNYESAVRFFSDAVNLKPDYANAYFNLAIALRDKGDLANAKLIADQTVTLLQKDSNFAKNPDYKKATDLAADLKTKAGAKVAATVPGAPAAQTDSALGNTKLPNVNVPDLNNPPQVATPAAVKANPNAVLPQATPTKTP